MIDPELLAVLRCPLDPQREATLTQEETRIYCAKCRVRFPGRDGIINFVTSEAILPENISSIAQLPCQKHTKK